MDTTLIFKAYDVRGTYPDQLNEDVARATGSAFATFVGGPRVVVARDMRPSRSWILVWRRRTCSISPRAT